MSSERFTFGGVTVEIRGESDWIHSKQSALFHAEPSAKTDHLISLEYAKSAPAVPPCATKSGPVNRWTEDDAVHTLKVYGTDQFAYSVRTPGQTRLSYGLGYRDTMYSQAILESADLFDILADYGRLVLHSSFIIVNGVALLFTGPSGIGKSTQASLWQEYASADIINGDRSLIRLDDLTANGVFYSGTSRICQNASAPIRAIVLLSKSGENTLRRAGAKEAFAALLSQCAYYQWDAESASRMTLLAAQLVERANVYCLSCRVDESAVRLLQNELFGGQNGN
jgi:hypothetical protein